MYNTKLRLQVANTIRRPIYKIYNEDVFRALIVPCWRPTPITEKVTLWTHQMTVKCQLLPTANCRLLQLWYTIVRLLACWPKIRWLDPGHNLRSPSLYGVPPDHTVVLARPAIINSTIKEIALTRRFESTCKVWRTAALSPEAHSFLSSIASIFAYTCRSLDQKTRLE